MGNVNKASQSKLVLCVCVCVCVCVHGQGCEWDGKRPTTDWVGS